ncbi:PepSY domain-containing protein [Xanthobacter autotrophicus]
MKGTWFASCLLVACLTAGPAAADRDCNVPLADWQPREALQKKLEAEGWSVQSIHSDDGCYKVRAANVQGERLKAKYDPASLERLRHGKDGADDD